MNSFKIETERMVLRSWCMADCEPFAKLAEDPEVMRFLPALDRSRSDAIVARMIAAGERDGHCAWVLEARSSDDFLGF